MNILITGCNGQLGTELIEIIGAGASEIGPIPELYKGAKVTAIDIQDLDLADCGAVAAYAAGEAGTEAAAYSGKFDLILNCAAMTNVDACETDAEAAMKGNAIAPRNVAALALAHSAKLVHVSTDYVFSGAGAGLNPGEAPEPYKEWELPAPATAYGKSKLEGERYVQNSGAKAFIVRTAWLYGKRGNNFVRTIHKLASEKDSIKVVNDQVGNPTNANDLAHHLLLLAATEEYGTFHCTGGGICSWYDFAKEIVRLAGLSCKVEPCTTEEFPRPAPRPAYSAMDHLMLRCTVGDHMRPWEDALASFMRQVF